MKKILLLLAVSLLTMPMMAQTDGSDDAPQGNGDLRKMRSISDRDSV